MSAGEGKVSGAASVGERLARAREAAGLSIADLAATTRIPARHLQSIEAGDFAALPGRSYAVGFAKTFARAVGEDEGAVASAVAADYAAAAPQDDSSAPPAFTPGDPARVPSSRFAWAAAVALAVVGAGGFVWWQNNHAASDALPSLLPVETPAPVASTPDPAPSAEASVTPDAKAPVVLTAEMDKLWLKISDSAGQQILQKQLALGESYTVPAEAQGPTIWTGRPDKLAITVGGQPIPKLAEEQKTVKGMPISAEALLARAKPQPVTAPQPSPSSSASVLAASPAASSSASTTAHARPKPAFKPRPRPASTDSEASIAQRALNAQPAAATNPSTAPQ